MSHARHGFEEVNVVSHLQLSTQPTEICFVKCEPIQDTQPEIQLSSASPTFGTFNAKCVRPEYILPEVQWSSPLPVVEQLDPITYTIVEEGTIKGRNLLLDSRGFRYSLMVDKRYKGSKITWRCTARGRKRCRAKVTQDGGIYIPSNTVHNHRAQPVREWLLNTIAEVKKRSGNDMLSSALAKIRKCGGKVEFSTRHDQDMWQNGWDQHSPRSENVEISTHQDQETWK